MIDVTRTLCSGFASAHVRYAKAADMLSDAELVRHYADTANRFERLHASIDRIPPAMVRLTEQLAMIAGRTRFDAALAECLADIGRRSFPENAAEILGALNLSLRFAEYRLAGD
jgi:uncharacterized protein (DUF2236 family)